MDATSLVKTDDPGIIVHAWGAGRARLNPVTSVIPPKKVSEIVKDVRLAPAGKLGKRRGWKVSEVMFPGYWNMLSIVGDLPAADLKKVVAYALVAEDMLTRQIGAEPNGIPYRIKIFKDLKEFKEVAAKAGAAQAASYYSPSTHSITMHFDKVTIGSGYFGGALATHDDLQSILAHEFTHAFMDIVWGRHSNSSPIWFLEGMAEYFQHFSWEGGRAVGGALAKREIQILANNEPVPIAEFVRIKRERMYSQEFPQLYAQAYVVTHFLQTYHQDKVRGLLAGDDVNVRGLEAAWLAHFNEMKREVGVV